VPYPLKKLRKILTSFGAVEDRSRGKGSHTMFIMRIGEKTFSYPIPTHDKDVKDCYIRGVRKRFLLTPDDAVSDEEFFSRA
jgi:hypothetical protein